MRVLPFDTMLYQEGLRRGYSPIAMSAAVGNRYAESAGNPLGAVGDLNLGPGQEAFGGFQWRLDRQQRLRQLGDVNDPQTHINHFFNELDTTESKAGQMLRNAKTLAEANSAMQAYLRYKDENGASSKRLGMSQEAAQMLGNGMLPMGSMPSGNEQVYSPQQQVDDRFFRPENFGNSLTRAGAALAGISNPDQAASMLRGIQDEEFQTTLNPELGMIVRVNKRTGATQLLPAPQLQMAQQGADQRDLNMYRQKLQIDKEFKTKPADSAFRTATDKIEREATGASQMADRVANLSKAIDDGELTPDLVNRFKDSAFSLLNLSPEKRAGLGLTPRQIELMSELERFKNTAALEDQLKQAGVQTDKDFLNNIKARFSSTDLYDPMKLRGALNETMKDFANRAQIASENYVGRSKVFPDDPSISMPERVGRMTTIRENSSKYLTEYENNKRKWSEEGAKLNQPAQSAAPITINNEADYNKLPSGSIFIGPDGKKYRKN